MFVYDLLYKVIIKVGHDCIHLYNIADDISVAILLPCWLKNIGTNFLPALRPEGLKGNPTWYFDTV